MNMEVLAFGQVAAITGGRFTIAPSGDVDALRNALLQQYPALQSVKFAVAVNNTIAGGGTLLSGADTIALLPPFSGG